MGLSATASCERAKHTRSSSVGPTERARCGRCSFTQEAGWFREWTSLCRFNRTRVGPQQRTAEIDSRNLPLALPAPPRVYSSVITHSSYFLTIGRIPWDPLGSTRRQMGIGVRHDKKHNLDRATDETNGRPRSTPGVSRSRSPLPSCRFSSMAIGQSYVGPA